MNGKIMYQIKTCRNSDAHYVVLSSGLGGHGHFWATQIEALSAYFHVLSYDQHGCHADSDRLPDDYSFDDLAQQVFDILKQEKISQFHFIGHAIGGFIGASLAVRCQSTDLTMLSLSCINTWYQLDPHTEKCFAARLHLLQNSGADAYVRAQALFLYPPAWISQHHHAITQAENKQLADFPPICNVKKRIQLAQNFQFTEQHQHALQSVALHFIANQDDFLVPVAQSKKLQHYFGHGTLCQFPTGAHASTVTEPAQINTALLSFLHRLSVQNAS